MKAPRDGLLPSFAVLNRQGVLLTQADHVERQSRHPAHGVEGFGIQRDDVAVVPTDGLRIAVRGSGRKKPGRRGSVIDGGAEAVRNYRAPGAYVVRVEGPTAVLAPYLLARLLTAPNMAGAVARCKRAGCAHFVVVATGKPGPPRQFCSAACREWARELDKARTQRRPRKQR